MITYPHVFGAPKERFALTKTNGMHKAYIGLTILIGSLISREGCPISGRVPAGMPGSGKNRDRQGEDDDGDV